MTRTARLLDLAKKDANLALSPELLSERIYDLSYRLHEELNYNDRAAVANAVTTLLLDERDGVERVVRYTTSSERLDGFGAVSEPTPYLDERGRAYRKLSIREEHLEWQTGKLLSGGGGCYTEEAFQGNLANGYARRAEVSA